MKEESAAKEPLLPSMGITSIFTGQGKKKKFWRYRKRGSANHLTLPRANDSIHRVE